MTEWYYATGDETHEGPVSDTDIAKKIEAGLIGPETLVWKAGMPDWAPAATQFAALGAAGGAAAAAEQVPAPAPPHPGTSGGGALTPPSELPRQTPQAGGHTGPDGLYIGAPGRNFSEAISVCFRKYVTFSGRASRSEYWFFNLFLFLVGVATSIIDAVLFPSLLDVSPINSLASLATALPAMAVSWRRLHDIDRSGWWIGGFYIAILVFAGGVGFAVATGAIGEGALAIMGLFGIVFLVYVIVLIVFFCTKGQPGPNRFG